MVSKVSNLETSGNNGPPGTRYWETNSNLIDSMRFGKLPSDTASNVIPPVFFQTELWLDVVQNKMHGL